MSTQLLQNSNNNLLQQQQIHLYLQHELWSQHLQHNISSSLQISKNSDNLSLNSQPAPQYCFPTLALALVLLVQVVLPLSLVHVLPHMQYYSYLMQHWWFEHSEEEEQELQEQREKRRKRCFKPWFGTPKSNIIGGNKSNKGSCFAKGRDDNDCAAGYRDTATIITTTC